MEVALPVYVANKCEASKKMLIFNTQVDIKRE